MKKSNYKSFFGVIILMFCLNPIFAQQGLGTNKPNKASVLDLSSNKKGLLLPRIALQNTTNFNPITGIPLNEAHTANSLIVYNTAVAGTSETAVKPGYYFWEKLSSNSTGKWKRFITENEISDFIINGDVTGTLGNTRVNKIQNVPVSATLPSNGQVLQYNGSNWLPVNLDAPTVTSVSNGLSLNGTVAELGGNLSKATAINQNGNSLTVATGGSNLIISGLKKTTVQNNSDYLLSVGSDNVVKALKASMPKFFYMPSMLLPLAQDQIVPSMHTTFSNGVFTVNLYNVYAEQFGGTNSANSVSNPTKTTSLPVLPKQELDYFITFFDQTVYTNVAVTNDGILTYRISSQADPNSGSFMNIVFAVKP